MDKLTLIIPAKNEKESLPKVLEDLKKYNLNIIIILEKSDLETIQAVQDYKSQICYQKNKGYGDALIEGINSVQTDYFCIFNADGSFRSDELTKMYEKLENENKDFIFGSRYEKNSSSEDDTIVTYVGNTIFSLIGKIFFSLNITDILYTFVMGKTKKAKDLNLKSIDFAFCVELPIKAAKKGFLLDTIPCNEMRRIAGKKKVNAFRDGLKILIAMIKLYFFKY